MVRIVVQSPSYGRAEAEVQVPIAPPIESLRWEADTTYIFEWGDVDDSSYQLTFNLAVAMSVKDRASTADYYKFSYREPSAGDTDPADAPWTFSIGNFIYEREPIFSEHIGLLDAISGNDSESFTFFTDRRFSGGTYTLNLHFENNHYTIMKYCYMEGMPDCDLTFTLSTISPSYYNWCAYQWNIENGTIGDLGDIGLTDPVWGYSNVSSGAGVVAAQSRSTYTVNLKDFLQQEISAIIKQQQKHS